jgi:guanine deaminase
MIDLRNKYMYLAVKEARKNIKDIFGGPFGACIVKGNKVLAVARNTVLKDDATCHAEINAIRKASRALKKFDLSGCVIYSTTEPCPMCFSAIHWARLDAVIFGTAIRDARLLGFNELGISCRRLKIIGKSRVKIGPRFMVKECRKLFKDWDDSGRSEVY